MSDLNQVLMNRTLSIPQAEAFCSTAKSTAAIAGFGSGKTDMLLDRCFSTMIESPGMDMGYFAPTFPLIDDIWFPKVEERALEVGLDIYINKSKHNIHVHGLGTIFCRPMTHPERIVGFEIGDALIDELDIISIFKALEVWRKIKARCRMKFKNGKINQMFAGTTPEGFKAMYQLFKKSPLIDSHLVQMSTWSNEANLPVGYIDDLFNTYPPELIDAYIDGMFVNLTAGVVYKHFNRKKMYTSRKVKKGEHLHIGMDFNVDNMHATVFAPPERVELGMKNFIVSEVNGATDTPEMVDAIKDKFQGHKITIYPDASGRNRTTKGASTSDIKILKQAGFAVKSKDSNPLVRDRVITVNRFCEKGLLFINPDEAPDTTEALECQVYNKAGQPDKDGGFDHPCDATGYRLSYDWLVGKPQLDYVSALVDNM